MSVYGPIRFGCGCVQVAPPYVPSGGMVFSERIGVFREWIGIFFRYPNLLLKRNGVFREWIGIFLSISESLTHPRGGR